MSPWFIPSSSLRCDDMYEMVNDMSDSGSRIISGDNWNDNI